MSNLGLERYLKSQNLGLTRTKVGDRHVVEEMRRGGYNVGGEQSGHIILSDFGTTGDGMIAALQFLACVAESEKPASEVARVFEPLPQILRNVSFAKGQLPLDNAGVIASIADGERQLDGTGRLLVRKSGTEPLIRVMAEGEDSILIGRIVDNVAEAIATATAG
jgi:phosphoglucosamine mutase